MERLGSPRPWLGPCYIKGRHEKFLYLFIYLLVKLLLIKLINKYPLKWNPLFSFLCTWRSWWLSYLVDYRLFPEESELGWPKRVLDIRQRSIVGWTDSSSPFPTTLRPWGPVSRLGPVSTRSSTPEVGFGKWGRKTTQGWGLSSPSGVTSVRSYLCQSVMCDVYQSFYLPVRDPPGWCIKGSLVGCWVGTWPTTSHTLSGFLVLGRKHVLPEVKFCL